jgi:hypothetical protein
MLLVMLAAAAAAVVIILIASQLKSRRREAIRQAALGLGFEFEPEAPGLVDELRDLKTLSHGYSHRLRNVLRGARGDVSVVVADHRWVTGAGKNQQVHRASLVVLRRPHLALPHFFLRPQVAIVDSIGKLFGGQDLDFPEDAEFSRAFVLQGEDEAAARALFGPSVRPQLLQLAHGLRLEGRGDTLLVQTRHAVPAEEVAGLIDAATALLGVVASALPAHW